MTLTNQQLLALKECSEFMHGTYCWRWSTMKKLEASGLVRKIPHSWGKMVDTWELTEDGKNVLQLHEEK